MNIFLPLPVGEGRGEGISPHGSVLPGNDSALPGKSRSRTGASALTPLMNIFSPSPCGKGSG